MLHVRGVDRSEDDLAVAQRIRDVQLATVPADASIVLDPADVSPALGFRSEVSGMSGGQSVRDVRGLDHLFSIFLLRRALSHDEISPFKCEPMRNWSCPCRSGVGNER